MADRQCRWPRPTLQRWQILVWSTTTPRPAQSGQACWTYPFPTVSLILLHPPPNLVGVSTGTERGCQQIESALAVSAVAWRTRSIPKKPRRLISKMPCPPQRPQLATASSCSPWNLAMPDTVNLLTTSCPFRLKRRPKSEPLPRRGGVQQLVQQVKVPAQARRTPGRRSRRRRCTWYPARTAPTTPCRRRPPPTWP